MFLVKSWYVNFIEVQSSCHLDKRNSDKKSECPGNCHDDLENDDTSELESAQFNGGGCGSSEESDKQSEGTVFFLRNVVVSKIEIACLESYNCLFCSL